MEALYEGMAQSPHKDSFKTASNRVFGGTRIAKKRVEAIRRAKKRNKRSKPRKSQIFAHDDGEESPPERPIEKHLRKRYKAQVISPR